MDHSNLNNLSITITRGRTKGFYGMFGQWETPTPLGGPPLQSLAGGGANVGMGSPVIPTYDPCEPGYLIGVEPPLFYSGLPVQPFRPRIDHVPPKWFPTDITSWVFTFAMSKGTLSHQTPNVSPALYYNPLPNLADPTTGVMFWRIYDTDTAQLDPGNYYFQMTIIKPGTDAEDFAQGVVALTDSLGPSPGNVAFSLDIYTFTYVSLMADI